jgi:hypothetical protein
VDGSELARTYFTFAALVGAPMCSACFCGKQAPEFASEKQAQRILGLLMRDTGGLPSTTGSAPAE